MRKAILVFLLLVTAWSQSGHAQVVTTRHEPGFVELVAGDVPEGASITWEPRKPLDLPILDRMNLAGQRVAIMHLQPGKYNVLLDIIDWENRKRIKRVYALVVEGELPGPIPPSPPNPTPPEPDVPDNPFDGLLGDIHTEARNGPWKAAQVQGLADNYETVASAIEAGGIPSIRLAAQRLRELNSKLGATDPWHKMKGLITSYLQEEAGPEGTMTVKEYAKHLAKIAEAMR